METKASDNDRAQKVFHDRIHNLLVGEGAKQLPSGGYVLDTPAGGLLLTLGGNRIIGQFASPLGGRWATGESDAFDGKWSFRVNHLTEAYVDVRSIEDFAGKLGDILAFKPRPAQRDLIMLDLAARRRDALRTVEFFAAIPDPDAPKPKACKPPLGVLVVPVRNKTSARKPATHKAAKPKGANDAKPKRRGRVAKRKVGGE